MMSEPENNQVTRLLNAIADGDTDASSQLLELVYDELRDLARAKMRHLAVGHTLQPTALVHEAYLKLVGGKNAIWESRRHFFGSAARAMRNILVDDARRKGSEKHGGGRHRVTFDDRLFVDGTDAVDILALNDALSRMEESDPEKADIIMLRYFAGLSVERTAEVLDVSTSTVDRRWSFARAWLLREISKGETRG